MIAQPSRFTKVASVLTFLATTAAALATAYGVWFVIPNFIEQKRHEIFSNNAAKALEILVDVEESFRKLLLITKKPSVEPNEHINAQLQVSLALNQLRTRLLLLQTFKEIAILIPQINSLREKLDHIFESKASAGSAIALDEFMNYWKSDAELNLKQIGRLREVLLNIYEIRERICI